MPTVTTVSVKKLQLQAIVGVDAWERIRPQCVNVNLECGLDFIASPLADVLDSSLDYGKATKRLTQLLQKSYVSLEDAAEAIVDEFLSTPRVQNVSVRVEIPKALLYSATLSVECGRVRSAEDCIFRTLKIEGLWLRVIVGLNPWERERKQTLLLNVTLPFVRTPGRRIDYRSVEELLLSVAEGTAFETVESLAALIGDSCLAQFQTFQQVTVEIEKPSALTLADAAVVRVQRLRSEGCHRELETRTPSSEDHIAYLGVGSNLEDRLSNIHGTLDKLAAHAVKILDTSFLYETSPMYVVDQPAFLNAVCKVGLCNRLVSTCLTKTLFA